MPSDFAPIAFEDALCLLAEMRGEICWGVRCSGDNLLFFEFGAPYLCVQDTLGPILQDGVRVGTKMTGRWARAMGHWSFWVEDGQWTASANGLACCRQDAVPDENCLYYLSGQKLLDVAWHAAEQEWHFALDFGGTIALRAPLPDDVDSFSWQWLMRCRDRYTLECVQDASMRFSNRGPRA